MNNHLPNPSPGPRLYELDALRGLAAVYVMLSHYLHDCARMYDGNAVTLLTLPFSGQYAVHLFFVISGFVIFMTLQRCRNTADFILNRVGRLFPAYLIAVVGTTLVSMWLSEYDIKPPVTLTQFAANLTMMHSFLGDIPAIDGVYWSLMVELAFYFWMGLLFAGGLLRRIELVAWLWLVVALGAYAIQNATDTRWSEPVRAAGLFVWSPLFFSGCMFYRISNGAATAKTHLLIIACAITYVLVLVAPTLVLGKRDAIAAVAVYLVFYLFVYGRLRWLAVRPLVFLGQISYALYILHSRCGQILLAILKIKLNAPLWVALSLTIVVAVLLASCLTFLVERPANALIRKWRKQRTLRN